MSRARAVALFLAFASGYFFSALLRAVTATLAPVFSGELHIGAADLGLLSGAFFAGFVLTQLPLGLALDRFGPKRVLMTLMALAVLACLAFSQAHSFQGLWWSRFALGVGLSASLMAALTAFRRLYPPDALVRANAWMLMTGSLGMLVSTWPVQALLPHWGWRGLFVACAVGIGLCALLVLWWVPADEVPVSSIAESPPSYLQLVSHPVFRRSAGLGLWSYAGLVAVQTLWAGPWFTQVLNLTPVAASQGLFVFNAAMLLAFALLGVLLPRWSRSGWGIDRCLAWASPLFALATLALAWIGPSLGVAGLVAWGVLGSVLSASQVAVAQRFPTAWAGRVLSAFNLLIFLGIFAIQWGLGGVIDLALAQGLHRVDAHRWAMAVLGFGNAVAAAVFTFSKTPSAAQSVHP